MARNGVQSKSYRLMEWQLKIPKIFHVYWGGGPMSYLRFMTIKSFMKYNPDWEIRYYHPTTHSIHKTWVTNEQKYDVTLCDDYTPELMKLPITKFQVDFQIYNFNNDMPEVHKSDFLRLELLSTIGGLWSDMDIIYFKSMNSLYFNCLKYSHIETFYCDHNYGHSIGFLMSSPENKFFAKLKEIAIQEYSPLNYQSLGCVIYNKYFKSGESIEALTASHNISMDVVYAHDAGHIEDIVNTNQPKFTEESIGIHWYGGSPIWKNFIITTNGGLNNLPDNIIGNLLKSES